jgi:hypothetical protein
MKTKSILWLLLIAVAIFSSCKKDTAPEPKQADFFSNPEAYALFIRYDNNNIVLLEFKENNRIYESNIILDDDMITYVKVDANTIDIPNRNIRIKRSGVELPESVAEHHLIKKTEHNSLAGNTYTGSYLKADGSILHQNFYYTFGDANTDILLAGYSIGTPLRTESYTIFANMAARVSKENSQGDTEYMIAVGDKLYVSYRVFGQQVMYHGMFTRK